MGWDLNIAIESFDEKKEQWRLLSTDALREGRIEFYEEEKALKKAISETKKNLERKYYDNDEEWLAEVNNEAEALVTNYFLFSVDRNYALFKYLADVVKDDDVESISGLRGLPLDSSLDRAEFAYHTFSFLTYSEIKRINWKERIDVRNRSYPVKNLYPSFRDNPRGPWLEITKEQFEASDKAARKTLQRHNLFIKVDEPIYLEEIEEFLSIVDLMAKKPKSSIAIRMLLIFDH